MRVRWASFGQFVGVFVLVPALIFPAVALAGVNSTGVDSISMDGEDTIGCCADMRASERPVCPDMACCFVPAGLHAVSGTQGFAAHLSATFRARAFVPTSGARFVSQSPQFGRPKPSILFCSLRT